MPKIINVYFNGTDDSNDVPDIGRITLAALLDQLTVKDELDNFSICVNGCGVETQDIRDLGAIFTFHLEKQVTEIAKQIEDIAKFNQVTLNVYGFSRGGAAAFWLCQKLKHIPADKLSINVASFEPVPGNFVTGVYGDILLGTNTTLSAAVADLTACKNIKNMLVLFTNQPLPDIVCHAPLLPAFPSNCKTTVDVTPGCHKSAVSFYICGQAVRPTNTESAIVFHRIIEFMQQCGTIFDFTKLKLNSQLIHSTEIKEDNSRLLKLYDELARKTAFSDHSIKRSMHLHNTIFTKADNKKYLNRFHQELLGKEANDKDSMLSIEHTNTQRVSPQQRKAVQFMQLVLALAIAWNIYNKYFNEPAEAYQPFRP